MLRLVLILMATLPGAALAAGCDRPTPLRFPPGQSGAIVEGGVPRGTPDCWTLNARAGQVMEARLASAENNAVLTLHPPGWRLGRDRSGGIEIQGKVMAGPAAASGRLTLPSSGDYLLVIGTTRGSAEYRLGVMVR